MSSQKPKTRRYKPTPPKNPGGRPKLPKSIRELAKEYSEDAMHTIIRIMEDPDAPQKVRLQAAQAILDRAYGKPQQQVDMNVSTDLVSLLVGLADGKAPRADSGVEERSGAIRH